jgi:threonine aldolase
MTRDQGPPLVDLFSDTVTRPTPAMRRAMAEAEVGDEQQREDPTVNRLQDTVAGLLGKEAALFLPSGTMCNQVAFAVHCRPGDEILLHETAHPLLYEAGGPAAMIGAVMRPLPGPRGIFSADQVRQAIRPAVHYMPRTRAVSVEQTANIVGGVCWPLEEIRAIGAVTREEGLALHLDGARLLNAVVASGTPARDFAAPCDSVWIDLTKGLGAPVGAVLAGSRDFIEAAWVYKQRFGGAMRQAGIIAAAGLHALEHHVERLAEDHRRARELARGLAELPGIAVDADRVETNIVIFDLRGAGLDAERFAARTLARGVRFTVIGPTTVRAVTHLDLPPDAVARALDAARAALQARPATVSG